MCNAQVGLDEWLETFGVDGRVEFGEQSLHETQVDGADDIAMVLCHLAKRAMMQPDLPGWLGSCLRRESDDAQRPGQLLDGTVLVHAAKRWRGLGEEPAPSLPGFDSGAGRLVDVGGHEAGQDLCQEPVTTLPDGTALGTHGVETARPSWPAPLLDNALYQPGPDESIEVEPDGIGVQAQPGGDPADSHRVTGVLNSGQDTRSALAHGGSGRVWPDELAGLHASNFHM